MNIEIVNGRVFVEGKETVNPELIGYAILDAVESDDIVICSGAQIDEVVKKAFDAGFKASETLKCIHIGIVKNDCTDLNNGQFVFTDRPHESVVRAAEKLKERLNLNE